MGARFRGGPPQCGHAALCSDCGEGISSELTGAGRASGCIIPSPSPDTDIVEEWRSHATAQEACRDEMGRRCVGSFGRPGCSNASIGPAVVTHKFGVRMFWFSRSSERGRVLCTAERRFSRGDWRPFLVLVLSVLLQSTTVVLIKEGILGCNNQFSRYRLRDQHSVK